VREASRKYFAPNKLTYVLVGDAARIASDLEAFADVEVVNA
jgi:hypothetical protein